MTATNRTRWGAKESPGTDAEAVSHPTTFDARDVLEGELDDTIVRQAAGGNL